MNVSFTLLTFINLLYVIAFNFPRLPISRHRISSNIVHIKATPSDQIVSNDDERKLALELLDCLTSPYDSEDPLYDVEKDIRRDQLLQTNDYHDLKLELRERGLRTNGDKAEMMIRLLLHIVDPNLSFNAL